MSTDVFTGKPRRLHWTCRYCGHTFKTYTRRGLRVTCPQCHRVQEGPAGVTRLFDKATKKHAESKPVTTLKIVAVNGQQPKPKPAVKPAPPKPAPKAAAAPATPPVAPPAKPTEPDPILRFIRGE